MSLFVVLLLVARLLSAIDSRGLERRVIVFPLPTLFSMQIDGVGLSPVEHNGYGSTENSSLWFLILGMGVCFRTDTGDSSVGVRPGRLSRP